MVVDVRIEKKEDLSIQEIGQISITILMDNFTDFLLINSKHAIRPPFIKNDKFILPPPVAEHGFSALISIPKSEQGTGSLFLFDTGVSENGVIHNAEIFGIDFSNIDGIILSHGHFDPSTAQSANVRDIFILSEDNDMSYSIQ